MDLGMKTTATKIAKLLPTHIEGKVGTFTPSYDIVKNAFFSDRFAVLITGVSPGSIGEATALAVASQRPEHLFLASKSKTNVDQASQNIQQRYPEVVVDCLLLDLASQLSVRKAASKFNDMVSKLDTLINNADIMAISERTLSAEGIELHFATNHIGHFLFTNLILGKLICASREAVTGATRIINVSSNAHRFSPVRFSDWNFEGKLIPLEQQPNERYIKRRMRSLEWKDGYEKFVAYGQSKTANILFSLYLREYLATEGVQSYSVHHGSESCSLIA